MQADYHSSGHHASQPGKEILGILLESTELCLRADCFVFHEAPLKRNQLNEYDIVCMSVSRYASCFLKCIALAPAACIHV